MFVHIPQKTITLLPRLYILTSAIISWGYIRKGILSHNNNNIDLGKNVIKNKKKELNAVYVPPKPTDSTHLPTPNRAKKKTDCLKP